MEKKLLQGLGPANQLGAVLFNQLNWLDAAGRGRTFLYATSWPCVPATSLGSLCPSSPPTVLVSAVVGLGLVLHRIRDLSCMMVVHDQSNTRKGHTSSAGVWRGEAGCQQPTLTLGCV